MPRYLHEISDEEVARRARTTRRLAERARETYDGKRHLPVWEVAFLNPCDWTHLSRSTVSATDEEAAIRAVLRDAAGAVTRAEVVAVRDVSPPAWERNCAVM